MESMSFDELEGILQRTQQAADERWKKAAGMAIDYLIRAGKPFTADDVWQILEPLGVTTHEPNAMGAMFNAARREGKITSDGMYRPSCRRTAHRRMVRVWRAAE